MNVYTEFPEFTRKQVCENLEISHILHSVDLNVNTGTNILSTCLKSLETRWHVHLIFSQIRICTR